MHGALSYVQIVLYDIYSAVAFFVGADATSALVCR